MKLIGPLSIKKVIFVDRTNQNIATLEQEGGDLVGEKYESVTTGANRPPYQQADTTGNLFCTAEIVGDALPEGRDR